MGRPAGAAGSGRRAQVGHPEPHREAPAVDLGGHVALDGRHLVLGRRRRRARRRLGDQAAQVEGLLDPLGRVGGRDEIGVAQDGLVGGQGGGHARDARLADGPEHAPASRLAVGGPHDQLGDEVVVVLRDRVAGLVAGIEADARARRLVERGQGAGRGREPPAAGVLGVDPDLDGVPVAARRRPG